MPLDDGGNAGPERPSSPLDDVRKSLEDVGKSLEDVGRSLDDVRQLTDSQTLRALTHPVRIALIEALLLGGAMTATEVGERISESATTCSFHLRQLAKYGMAEEAPGGRGRERPWQATTMSTDVPDFPEDPELAAAGGKFRAVLAERYFEWLRRWLDQRPDEPGEWQRADQFGDKLLYLTASELAEVGQRMRDLFDEYVDRTARPELRPPDARLISVLQFAFPVVGHLGIGPRPSAGERTSQDVAPGESGDPR
jgi:hypothetical protein